MTSHQGIVTLQSSEGKDRAWWANSLSHHHSFVELMLPSCCVCYRGFKENTMAKLSTLYRTYTSHKALPQAFISWLHFWVCAIVCHPVPWGLHCFFIKPSSCRNVPQLHPAHIPQLSLPSKRRGERPVNAKVLLQWGAGMWPRTDSQVPSVDVDYDTSEFLRKYHTNISYLRANFSTRLHQCKSGATAPALAESF